MFINYHSTQFKNDYLWLLQFPSWNTETAEANTKCLLTNFQKGVSTFIIFTPLKPHPSVCSLWSTSPPELAPPQSYPNYILKAHKWVSDDWSKFNLPMLILLEQNQSLICHSYSHDGNTLHAKYTKKCCWAPAGSWLN